MRDYEIVYIFRSSFTPEEIDAKLERYHALITGVDGGQITAVEQWGKRQLAYPIDKEPNGFYVVAQFASDPSALPELERILRLDDDLLRYLIVLSEGELPIPPSVREERDAAARRVAAEAARRKETAATGEAEAAAEPEAAESETVEEPEADAPDVDAEASDPEPEGSLEESTEAGTPVAEAVADADAVADAEPETGETDAEVAEPAAEKED
jgi:small subunit ribosomal protein S6